MRIMPRVPSYEEARRYFHQMSQSNRPQKFTRRRQLTGGWGSNAPGKMRINLVTPTAQAEEQAASAVRAMKRPRQRSTSRRSTKRTGTRKKTVGRKPRTRSKPIRKKQQQKKKKKPRGGRIKRNRTTGRLQSTTRRRKINKNTRLRDNFS